MRKIHVSNILEVENPRHYIFDFVDINIKKDQKLFIDPCLIAIYKDTWCKEATDTINSFFDEFYTAYRENNYIRKHELLSHAGEINYTKLGYGNGKNGHGNTAEGLMADFRMLDTLITEIDTISNVIDLPLLIVGFNEDGLSDLITNILHYQLNNYTLEQLKKYGVEANSTDKFYTWDVSTLSWKQIEQPCYKYDNDKILLTPKKIVRMNYIFSADHYLKNAILERAKQESASVNEKGKTVYGVTKKELLRRIDKTNKNWRYNKCIDKTIEDSSYLSDYHSILNLKYEDKDLDDDVLDKLIYQYP